MSASRLRLLAVALALGTIGAFATPAAAATQPPPGSEGPAGPPALMPNGQVATPPQVSSPRISTGGPAAPYGPQSAAPGSGKTVALTFDDGPVPAPPASCRSWPGTASRPPSSTSARTWRPSQAWCA